MIALHWDESRGVLDLALEPDGSLARDEGFHTPVLLSLLVDRRAPPGSDREGLEARGYWADAFEAEPWGSLLWLLAYAPLVEREAATRLRAYVEQSLGWMRRAGVVQTIVVEARVASRDAMALRVELVGREGGSWAQGWKWTQGSLHAA